MFMSLTYTLIFLHFDLENGKIRTLTMTAQKNEYTIELLKLKVRKLPLVQRNNIADVMP